VNARAGVRRTEISFRGPSVSHVDDPIPAKTEFCPSDPLPLAPPAPIALAPTRRISYTSAPFAVARDIPANSGSSGYVDSSRRADSRWRRRQTLSRRLSPAQGVTRIRQSSVGGLRSIRECVLRGVRRSHFPATDSAFRHGQATPRSTQGIMATQRKNSTAAGRHEVGPSAGVSRHLSGE